MKYIVGIKVVKEKIDNDPFGFKEITTYIDAPFDTKDEAIGYVSKVILSNIESGNEEYYFKYAHPENVYNRGYLSANSTIINSQYLDMIIKEEK